MHLLVLLALPRLAVLPAAAAEPAEGGWGETDDELVVDTDWMEQYRDKAPTVKAAWPDKVVLDVTASAVLLLWNEVPGTRAARALRLPFTWIDHFELKRATVAHPDELAMVGVDGDLFLVARGADVDSAKMLAISVTGRAVRDLPSDADWPQFGPSPSGSPPVFVLGSITADHDRMVAATNTAAGSERLAVRLDEDGSDPVAAVLAGKREGHLEKHQIDTSMKQHTNQLRRCYQRELQRAPDLEGQLVVRFVIGTEGAVLAAAVKASTLDNEIVETCVVDEVRGMVFPRPAGDGVVVVDYPLDFTMR